jgi:hypothetical protein
MAESLDVGKRVRKRISDSLDVASFHDRIEHVSDVAKVLRFSRRGIEDPRTIVLILFFEEILDLHTGPFARATGRNRTLTVDTVVSRPILGAEA